MLLELDVDMDLIIPLTSHLHPWLGQVNIILWTTIIEKHIYFELKKSMITLFPFNAHF